MAQNDRTTGLVGNAGIKVPVRVATTAAITLSGLQTIDGVTVVADDRVLVKNQADPIENGIYSADTGTWERAKDCDGVHDLVKGTIVYVAEGTVAAGLFYVQTTSDPDIGSDSLVFSVTNPGTPITVPVATTQGGTGGGTAIAGLANLGVVQVTGEGGTANVQTGTVDALVSALRADQVFIYTPSIANTSATTLELTPSGGISLGPKNVFVNGAALVGGELQAAHPVLLQYDGTQYNALGAMPPARIKLRSSSIDTTALASDANSAIGHPSSDNNPRTFTVPANASVPYPAGTTLTFYNGVNTLSIAITTDTATLAGVGSTGTRTLAANGIATYFKVDATNWLVSGTGIS